MRLPFLLCVSAACSAVPVGVDREARIAALEAEVEELTAELEALRAAPPLCAVPVRPVPFADLLRLLEQPSSFGRALLYRGPPDGYRLSEIRRDSLLARLGFRDGDLVTEVADIAVVSEEAAHRAHVVLQTADAVTVRVLRRGGEAVELRYEVVGRVFTDISAVKLRWFNLQGLHTTELAGAELEAMAACLEDAHAALDEPETLLRAPFLLVVTDAAGTRNFELHAPEHFKGVRDSLYGSDCAHELVAQAFR